MAPADMRRVSCQTCVSRRADGSWLRVLCWLRRSARDLALPDAPTALNLTPSPTYLAAAVPAAIPAAVSPARAAAPLAASPAVAAPSPGSAASATASHDSLFGGLTKEKRDAEQVRRCCAATMVACCRGLCLCVCDDGMSSLPACLLLAFFLGAWQLALHKRPRRAASRPQRRCAACQLVLLSVDMRPPCCDYEGVNLVLFPDAWIAS
jgi:hypothetical protein